MAGEEVPLTVAAILLLVSWLRSARSLHGAARSGESIEELGLKFAERTYEPMALYGVLILILGPLAVIGIIVVGVEDRLGDR